MSEFSGENLTLFSMPRKKTDHVAILGREKNLIPKILSGQKTIESRWYVSRIAPWDRIHAGDTVYFKDSGQPVTARAKVGKVRQYSGLNREKIKPILGNYGEAIGVPKGESHRWLEQLGRKNYCILISLKDPKPIKPFRIDKTGFGSACAWLCVGDIKRVRLSL